MKNIDYVMNEHSASKILEYFDDRKPVPNYILQNFITSSCSLLKNGGDFGPKANDLSLFIQGTYAYTDEIVDKPEFSFGLIYGALYFWKVWNGQHELH